MAQAATNPKIEELRFRIKSDAKSRLFYPLAEELRKISQLDEAESVLRTGLTNHPTYLSAWVSLGRVLRERKKNNEAVDALTKALQLDPGNVVAARILADAYLELGEKVEAIKKYKLVYALLPADEVLEETIARLDAEINAPAVPPEPVVEPPLAPAPEEPEAIGDSTEVRVRKAFVLPQFDTLPPPPPPPPAADAKVFDDTATGLQRQQNLEFENDDAHLAASKSSESPFAEPGIYEGHGADAFAFAHPNGMPVEGAPPTSELPMPLPYEPLPVEPEPEPLEPAASADEADVFEPAGGIAPGFVTEGYGVVSSMPPIDEADFTRTLRMAQLYVAEGSFAEARDIYEDLLARDPSNRMIREKLDALPAAGTQQRGERMTEDLAASAPEAPSAKEPPPSQPGASRNPKIERLESWLARVKRGEVGRV
ncbi:MAG: tetratricopeptide repeat protein [Thermoanaerobaculia bacterium]